jgi:regulator of protease activity HflC (stomatin/prohibitin superfamily)
MLLKDDVYLCVVSKAEDKDLIPLDLRIFLTIRIVNPYKSKFAVQNWLETVINRMEPSIRQYVAQYSFEELIPKKQIVGGEMWNKLKETGLIGCMEDPEDQKGEFINRYGVEVRAIEVQDISPPEGLQKIILAKTTAEREAAAEIAKARGDRQATIIRAKGEEKRLGAVYKKIGEFGDLGKLVRTLEAVEESNLAASIAVQAIPGLPEILRGIFGKTPEEATLKEIRELREIVEKILKTQGKK